MYRQLAFVAVAALCLFSIGVTVTVWSQWIAGAWGYALALPALGVEIAKYALLPISLPHWHNDKRKILVVFAAFVTTALVVLSVFTMSTFFDAHLSKQVAQVSNAQSSTSFKKRSIEQQLAANDQKLAAGDRLIEVDKVRGAAAISNGVVIVDTELRTDEKMNYLALSLPTQHTDRFALLLVVSAIVDLTALMLLIVLVITDTHVEKETVHPLDSHPLNKLRAEILGGPKNEPINISELTESIGEKKPNIEELVKLMVKHGELKNQSNRYYPA